MPWLLPPHLPCLKSILFVSASTSQHGAINMPACPISPVTYTVPVWMKARDLFWTALFIGACTGFTFSTDLARWHSVCVCACCFVFVITAVHQAGLWPGRAGRHLGRTWPNPLVLCQFPASSFHLLHLHLLLLSLHVSLFALGTSERMPDQAGVVAKAVLSVWQSVG